MRNTKNLTRVVAERSVSRCFILVALLFVLTGCASQYSEEMVTNLPPLSVEATDTNKDGNIDKAEFNTRLETLFDNRDINADGQISTDEMPNMNLDAFYKADQDSNRTLSEREYRLLREMDFRRLDVNDDEVLFPHEIFKW